MWNRDLMRNRPGVWLRSLISGLVSRPPLGFRREDIDETHYRLVPIYANRVQQTFLTRHAQRTA